MKAMIFAAGRGERMRPLTDHTPKPLLHVGGKPFIMWIIQALAQAGWHDIVINHAWLGTQFAQILGDGHQWGVRLQYSAEGDTPHSALETAGGIAHALPLLGNGVFLAISGDIYTHFDFSSLHHPAKKMATLSAPHMHLVMVDNPMFHPQGDFVLEQNTIKNTGTPRLTYANIGLFDTRDFTNVPPHTKAKLSPLLNTAIEQKRVSGEYFSGIWHNIGNPTQLSQLDQSLRTAQS